MRVLITGGEGFIGKNLQVYLKRKGLEVYSIDLKPGGTYKVDIRDYNAFEEIFSVLKPDAVIHLAAIASVPQCESNPRECFDTNVYGTFNVAKASKQYNTRLIFASSAAAYGVPRSLPTPVTHPLNPVNVYGFTKMLGEVILEKVMKENYVIFRIFNAYGERCYRSYVIPDVIRKIQSDLNPVPMKGTGFEERDFIYIEDVCRAFDVALNSHVSGTFNLGSGTRIKIRELATLIAELIGHKELTFAFEERPRIGDIPILHADISEGNIIPGWKPEYSLVEGLKRTIKWFLIDQYD